MGADVEGGGACAGRFVARIKMAQKNEKERRFIDSPLKISNNPSMDQSTWRG
jgi:hypothetical protein